MVASRSEMNYELTGTTATTFTVCMCHAPKGQLEGSYYYVHLFQDT